METEMNGRPKRDGNGNWGQTRFSFFERPPGLTRARHFDAQVSAWVRKLVPLSARTPLEDTTGLRT